MNLTHTPAWQALEIEARKHDGLHLRSLFADDDGRFERFSLSADNIFLDYSKQRVDEETLRLLRALAEERDFVGWRQRFLNGEAINHTEGRPVLHPALRAAQGSVFPQSGVNQVPVVQEVLGRMRALCESIHGGEWRGFSGDRITDVVNLGIGGSDLGARMAVQALSAWQQPDIRVHFVTNVDGADLATALAELNPRSTLFVLASKTCSTMETMTNAATARQWLCSAAGNPSAVEKHFVAVTANPVAAAAFGIPETNVFEFWDWVGGRFSLWSAVGLPLALAIGFHHFEALLAGGRKMDEHFFSAPPEENLPLTLALLALWNTSFLKASCQAVLPYSQSLALFPGYLQQLEMESLGKQVDRQGEWVGTETAPIVWGAAGTNGQHSFYQLIHQGGRLVPCDFIALKQADFPLPGHHQKLLAHCLAQSAALAFGQTLEEARALGADEALAPYQVFPGNQPSNTLILPHLDPFTLGQLIALYEHKVFALGVLWNLNAFDQWGVELGKQLAESLGPLFAEAGSVVGFDASTRGLLATLRS